MQQLHLAISVTTLILVVVFLLQLNEINNKEQKRDSAIKAAIYKINNGDI